MVQIRQSTRIFEWDITDAPCHGDQLFILGDGRICIPVLDKTSPFQSAYNNTTRPRFADEVQWWSRYNYILSAALDSGVAVGSIVIFFCLQYPNNGGFNLIWWGNSISQNTLDYNAAAFLSPGPPNGTFGLRSVSVIDQQRVKLI